MSVGIYETNPASAASEGNTFEASESAERQPDSFGGVNAAYMPENHPAEQNTCLTGSTGETEQSLVTMETKNNKEEANDVGVQDGEQGHQEGTNVGQGYLEEIKRRKFEKKAKSKLFVGGLALHIHEDFLHQQFGEYGEIIDACIVYQKGTNVPRGFGYVTFSNKMDAEAAIKGVDGMRTNGKTLCVEFADDPVHQNRPPPRHRSRSRSPHRPRGYNSPPAPPYHDRYAERDRFHDRDPYYGRERYQRHDQYDPHYPPRDGYRPPPPHDYYRSPGGMPPVEYKDRFGRDIAPPSSQPPRISEVDHARLRVNRERLRVPEYEQRSRGYRYYKSPSPEQRRSNDHSGNGSTHGKGGYSESNSSDDDNNEIRPPSPSGKPRLVSAFPSAYLK